MRDAWFLAILSVLVGCDGAAPAPDGAVDAGPVETDAGAVDARWDAFVAAREDHLAALAVPIEACVQRVDDASHPAFHGCYDWHSAVHGTFALLAVSRLTGDLRYAGVAESVLEPAAVAAELARLETSGVPREVPYGYAWFLVLARERARGGQADLAPLAVEVADDLEAFLRGLTPAEVEAGVLARDYDNISWAVLNLWEYAVFVGDIARADSIAQLARDLLEPWDAECPLSAEASQTNEFFPPCLHRVLALGRILPLTEARAWIERFAPEPPALPALSAPVTTHSAGLDFSRAWGLWQLWRLTSDVRWRDLYLDHVEAWLAVPQYWAEDYARYSHWVAQFGVYAIAASYED